MVRIDRLSPVAIARVCEESKLGVALTGSSFVKSCTSKRGAERAGGRIDFSAVRQYAVVML